VSSEALVWRLVSLNILKEPQARQLLDEPAFRGLDRATFVISTPPAELPERFQRLLETAYLAGEVSTGRVAEMTGRDLHVGLENTLDHRDALSHPTTRPWDNPSHHERDSSLMDSGAVSRTLLSDAATQRDSLLPPALCRRPSAPPHAAP
jgi:hypothetical protein